MKRLMLLAMIVSAFGVVGTANAGCTSENRGGSAGPYDYASATFDNVTVYAEQYGSFAGGPAYLCSDGQTGVEAAARGKLIITVDGVTVCDNSQRLSSDPFGFGAGIHSAPDSACGAELSWDGTASPFLPNGDDVAADGSGANGGLRKDTPVEGSFWYGGNTYDVYGTGFYVHGARAASEH